jgi:hypothetical protein
VTVTVTGERELEVRLDTFPATAHEKIAERIRDAIERLTSASQAAAPRRTGRLRSEIKGTVYTDDPNRVAGYVQVFAPGIEGEYAKAATLEYGSDKPRRIFERETSVEQRISGGHRRMVNRLTKSAHIRAFRYLRDPLEELRPAIEAGIAEALTDATQEAS